MLFLNILLVVTALIGAFLIAKKQKAGFLVYFITELCYAALGYTTEQYGLIAIAGVYLTMNMYSYVQWSK